MQQAEELWKSRVESSQLALQVSVKGIVVILGLAPFETEPHITSADLELTL